MDTQKSNQQIITDTLQNWALQLSEKGSPLALKLDESGSIVFYHQLTLRSSDKEKLFGYIRVIDDDITLMSSEIGQTEFPFKNGTFIISGLLYSRSIFCYDLSDPMTWTSGSMTDDKSLDTFPEIMSAWTDYLTSPEAKNRPNLSSSLDSPAPTI